MRKARDGTQVQARKQRINEHAGNKGNGEGCDYDRQKQPRPPDSLPATAIRVEKNRTFVRRFTMMIVRMFVRTVARTFA
jgi:hypothetical protein